MAKYEPQRPRGDRPLLLLGISDVVVLEEEPAVPATTHRVSAWGRWVRDVVIPDVAGQRLRELSVDFDIVWASEWGHNAHTAFAKALGLPDRPWPFIPVQFDKINAIRSYAQSVPWVWVDGPVVDLHDLGEVTDGVVVRVDPHRGIADVTPAELAAAVARRP